MEKQGNETESSNLILLRLGKEVAEGDEVEVETGGGTLQGRALVVLGAGSGLVIEQDQNTRIEITLKSAYASSGKFVYTVERKQPDGSWKIDESIATPDQILLLGGMRVSHVIKKLRINKSI